MAKSRKPASSKKVTGDDVELLLEVARLYNTEYDFQTKEWFWGEFKGETFEEFAKKYAQGSREFQFFERFTSRFELEGILIDYGFLNEELYFERYGSLGAEWERSKHIVYGLRKEWNEPRFRENFELLASRGSKWAKKHPPKITQT